MVLEIIAIEALYGLESLYTLLVKSGAEEIGLSDCLVGLENL